MDLITELAKINKDLSSKGARLRIEQRGGRLNLRGPLPCQNSKGPYKDQRISLRLNADHEGLKEAQKILQIVLFQLKQDQFDWAHWSNRRQHTTQRKEVHSAQEAVENFKSVFFQNPIRRRNNSGSLTTWSSAYLPYLKRLIKLEQELHFSLNMELLDHTLSSYPENSRSRQQCATALGGFARHLGLELPEDWRAKSNGYGLHKAHFRQLPSDNLITETWLKIPNPKWRLVYGMMATYGLRNHEVFFCDFSGLSKSGDKVVRVLPQTKTGEHQVWPFHQSWNDLFELEKLAEFPNSLPPINTDLSTTTLQNVGRRVSEQFRRYKLPITPYDLRHAWAIRTIHIGLPDTVSARMMGHSVMIHNKTYHHWITHRDQQQAVDTALAKKTI